MRRFYAPSTNFYEGKVTLDEGETRHLRDVLRLKSGDVVNVFDGVGNEFECVVELIAKRHSELSIRKKVEPMAPESMLDLTVAATVTPGEKFELAIQKSVELGVKLFIPIVSLRCEVKQKDAEKRLERWRKIAFEASKQCGRAYLMQLDNVKTFDQLLVSSWITDSKITAVFFTERDGDSFGNIAPAKAITAIYGPKGGWDDKEIAAAQASGATAITFGGRILRAETAAIAITAILQHRFGDLK